MTDSAPLTITAFTQQVKDLIEANFDRVTLIGEISNFTRASSGHLYFTLKDENAQLRGIMWKGNAARMKFDVHDGLEVVVSGKLEVYAARGSYQMICSRMTPQGMGELELAFQQLQEKLAKEGLFNAEHKQPIPKFPRRIALVTSPTGAAVRDMLQVMTRRWPGLDVVLLPVAVQGEGAAEQIAAAINYAPRIPGVDLIITGRGGGSLEDLWPFNEEIVAREIFACRTPIISAVGHEIDVSISDLVADRRALTPSEAGELSTPSAEDLSLGLISLQNQMATALRNRAHQARLQLESLASRPVFARPMQRIDDLRQQMDEWDADLNRSLQRSFINKRKEVEQLASRLDALSPLNVLNRGYSVSRQADGKVIKGVSDVVEGDKIVTRLIDGEMECLVIQVTSHDIADKS
ncbi:MAG: exodeoxyribonuclease VII large subunit [Planctomycetaceae bacterium]|nr:exodeoxyribonuclease VII large subunit [Planctomycetaceae bacterium]